MTGASAASSTLHHAAAAAADIFVSAIAPRCKLHGSQLTAFASSRVSQSASDGRRGFVSATKGRGLGDLPARFYKGVDVAVQSDPEWPAGWAYVSNWHREYQTVSLVTLVLLLVRKAEHPSRNPVSICRQILQLPQLGPTTVSRFSSFADSVFYGGLLSAQLFSHVLLLALGRCFTVSRFSSFADSVFYGGLLSSQLSSHVLLLALGRCFCASEILIKLLHLGSEARLTCIATRESPSRSHRRFLPTKNGASSPASIVTSSPSPVQSYNIWERTLTPAISEEATNCK